MADHSEGNRVQGSHYNRR